MSCYSRSLSTAEATISRLCSHTMWFPTGRWDTPPTSLAHPPTHCLHSLLHPSALPPISQSMGHRHLPTCSPTCLLATHGPLTCPLTPTHSHPPTHSYAHSCPPTHSYAHQLTCWPPIVPLTGWWENEGGDRWREAVHVQGRWVCARWGRNMWRWVMAQGNRCREQAGWVWVQCMGMA